jgi:hypothetical protein
LISRGTSNLHGRASSLAVPLFALLTAAPAWSGDDVVVPSLSANLVCYYDFDHPVAGNPGEETDLGSSGTVVTLVNGGAAMRVPDAAYPGAGLALQTQQVDPAVDGNDDWKAGTYDANGVTSLQAFSAVGGITLMGWVRPLGAHPGPNSTTPSPNDTYNAVGLFGLLSGTSDGHNVRALIEVINVSGTLRLVALGRRDDDGDSLILAADAAWETLLPLDIWTHVGATFDFDNGTMALYRNGESIPATYTAEDDRWKIVGDPEPDVTSATNPAGIKIGGSYPQNTVERNPFNGRFDDLMFFDRALAADEIATQYENFSTAD